MSDSTIDNGAVFRGRSFTGVGEQLAEAIRHGRERTTTYDSALANTLLPLLEALGSHHPDRDIVEALPHYVAELDLVDLRNIMVHLGYETELRPWRLDQIPADLYPALFLGEGGEIWVLLQHRGGEVTYLDARTNERVEGELPHLRGEVVLFTYVGMTQGMAAIEKGATNWFSDIAHRFRRWIIYLIRMTLFMHVIAVSVPLFIMVVYDRVIGSGGIEMLPFMLAGVVVALGIDFGLRLMRARIIGQIAGRLDYLIGVETFRKLILLPPAFTERSTVAAQLSRLKQFDVVRDLLTGPNATLALDLPFVGLFLLVVWAIAGPIAIIPLVMVVAYLLFGIYWMPLLARKVRRAGISRTDRQRMVIQTFLGRREIKAAGAEGMWLHRFREAAADAGMDTYRASVGNAVMHSVAQALVSLAIIAVLGVGASMVMNNTLSIGALIATMTLVWRILTPLQSTFLSLTQIQEIRRTVSQINQLMRLDTERDNGRSTLLVSEFEGRLELDRVSFRYRSNTDPAVLGVSFSAEPGEIVALAGNTGSGKSTLIKLIAGMYRPQAGRLMVDGVDLRQINAMELRRSIAYVPQNPHLFRGTIAQNMRLNNVLATDEDLRRAAEAAGVIEEIDALPDGFETMLGDRQTEALPPGYAHSLCMARAFLRDTSIVLLDEPGASLDRESDERLMEQISGLRGIKTVVLVTHRPSHLKIADKAVLLDHGSVEFVGDPTVAVNRLMEST